MILWILNQGVAREQHFHPSIPDTIVIIIAIEYLKHNHTVCLYSRVPAAKLNGSSRGNFAGYRSKATFVTDKSH